jgi:hypothetical protein
MLDLNEGGMANGQMGVNMGYIELVSASGP